MKIKLLALGKIKTSALQELAQDYQSRIKKLNPFEMIQVADEPVRAKCDLANLLQKEADRVQNQVSKHAALIVLDERGKQFSSEEFSQTLQGFFHQGPSELDFLIGSAYGIHEDLKKQAKLVWSLSKLTFPHQLVRVFALEQIYRALTIWKNIPYHHP